MWVSVTVRQLVGVRCFRVDRIPTRCKSEASGRHAPIIWLGSRGESRRPIVFVRRTPIASWLGKPTGCGSGRDIGHRARCPVRTCRIPNCNARKRLLQAVSTTCSLASRRCEGSNKKNLPKCAYFFVFSSGVRGHLLNCLMEIV